MSSLCQSRSAFHMSFFEESQLKTRLNANIQEICPRHMVVR